MKFGGNSTANPQSWRVSELGGFYLEHRARLVRHALRLLGDSHRAEEVVQDALVRVIMASPEFRNPDHLLAYLHKTIENLCLDIFRLEGRRPNLVVLDESTVEEELSLQDEKDLAIQISAADDAAIVRQALSMLSSAERAALVMWEIEGRSAEEISRELGIKQTSVRHTVSRARTSLRRIMSELIVDEKRGLTALDLLSTTYKKSVKGVKKSATGILAILLIFVGYLGFGNLISSQEKDLSVAKSDQSHSLPNNENQKDTHSAEDDKPLSSKNVVLSEKKSFSVVNVKAPTLSFPGLDSLGVPVGFTVTDGSNSLGDLYVSPREATLGESGLMLSAILKTSKGAANVLINESLLQDASGWKYDLILSFGRAGSWIPTLSRAISVDSERLLNGNYLITAVVEVKSEVVTSISIPASAGGRDLEVPPVRVVTRILLNPAKSQILAQAVQVVEKVSK